MNEVDGNLDLTLGMTVWYRGREYVIAGVRESEAPEGRSLAVDCLAPLYAQRNKMDSEARRTATEEYLRLIPKAQQ